MRKKGFILLMAACLILSAGSAMAATSASWIAPECGSTYLVGTVAHPNGQASGVGGTGGTGLDLMLVIDRSGSMFGSGIANAKSAADSLIDVLPTATTQAGLASFNSSATLDKQLAALSVAANVTALHTAVNSLVASGGTNIGTGINVAATELTSSRHVAGHAQMMVVLSDGYSSGDPGAAAASAYSDGIIVHSVGIPGHDPVTMQDIATEGHGVYTNVSDLSDLTDIFTGTGGNLVGLDYIDLTMPDGTLYHDYTHDGLGNFIAPDWALMLGDNMFTVQAFGTDGTSATAYCHIYGTTNGPPIPVPGSAILLGSGLLGLVGFRRNFWR
jgi:Ca-activated chloride channel family protein